MYLMMMMTMRSVCQFSLFVHLTKANLPHLGRRAKLRYCQPGWLRKNRYYRANSPTLGLLFTTRRTWGHFVLNSLVLISKYRHFVRIFWAKKLAFTVTIGRWFAFVNVIAVLLCIEFVDKILTFALFNWWLSQQRETAAGFVFFYSV